MALEAQTRGASSSSIQVLSRATQLLRTLHENPQGLSLSGLAERADLPRSTVHRLLAALEVEGFVASGAGGRMELGPELLRLGGGGTPPVQALLRPTMEALFADVEETVDLAVLDGDHLRFVDQIPAAHRLRAVSAVGAKFPLHCTANGKAVLALMDDDAVKDLLPARLPRFTPQTTTSRRELLLELVDIRADSLAIDCEEHTDGICAMGFAVDAGRGTFVAVTVPVPVQRFAGQRAVIERALRRARAATQRSL